MKVEREKFSPITITLQTQGEADLMWIIFHMPFDEVIKRSHDHIPECYSDLYSRMWKEFNHSYNAGW